MTTEIGSGGPCTCPPDTCARFCDPPDECIMRLTGEVVTKNCPTCHPRGNGSTWHQDGVCLKCRALGRSGGTTTP